MVYPRLHLCKRQTRDCNWWRWYCNWLYWNGLTTRLQELSVSRNFAQGTYDSHENLSKFRRISGFLKCPKERSWLIFFQPPALRAPLNPWPNWPRIFRVEYAHGEAKEIFKEDPRHYFMSPEAFLSEDGSGQVTTTKAVRMRWKRIDGKYHMVKDDTDTLVLFVCWFYFVRPYGPWYYFCLFGTWLCDFF